MGDESELNSHLRLIFNKVGQNCPMSRESAGKPPPVSDRPPVYVTASCLCFWGLTNLVRPGSYWPPVYVLGG